MRKLSVKSRWFSLTVAFVLIVGAGNLAYSAKPDGNVLTVHVEVEFPGLEIIGSPKGGGRLVIQFYSEEELEGIYDLIVGE